MGWHGRFTQRRPALRFIGLCFWSHDVPGFHTLPNFMNSIVAEDVYMRWTQFGVFTSHIRYHGTNKREPLALSGYRPAGEEVVETALLVDSLHHRAK